MSQHEGGGKGHCSEESGCEFCIKVACDSACCAISRAMVSNRIVLGAGLVSSGLFPAVLYCPQSQAGQGEEVPNLSQQCILGKAISQPEETEQRASSPL